jgi:hypothetical protein
LCNPGTRRHPVRARRRARPVGVPPYRAVHACRGRPTTLGPSAVPRGSCARYMWAQGGATRRTRMHRAAAPPSTIGSPHCPPDAIGRRRLHRLCAIPRPPFDDLVTPSSRHERLFKGRSSPGTRSAPTPEPPSGIGAATVNSILRPPTPPS